MLVLVLVLALVMLRRPSSGRVWPAAAGGGIEVVVVVRGGVGRAPPLGERLHAAEGRDVGDVVHGRGRSIHAAVSLRPCVAAVPVGSVGVRARLCVCAGDVAPEQIGRSCEGRWRSLVRQGEG
ncbi:hypothetical protein C8Q77DRAFT_1134188 [Trametes polyzona]|nr:hypothetical protein C8Q77DRAFT_1134188 [Trametes polyzona]